jgi:two-component system response regulator FixJ
MSTRQSTVEQTVEGIMTQKANLNATMSLVMTTPATFSATELPSFGAEIFVVDDDPLVGELLYGAFSSEGYQVTTFSDGEAFEAVTRSRTPPACVILDFFMPGRSALEILKNIHAHDYAAPIIVMSGMAAIPTAVEAIKYGAFDFIEKPFSLGAILERVREVIGARPQNRMNGNSCENLRMKFSVGQPLTLREAEVLAEIVAAASNKEAAQHLGISPRTIEVHRAHIMAKLGAKNAADLVRIAVAERGDRAQMDASDTDNPRSSIAVRKHSRSPTQQPAMIIVAPNLPAVRCTVIDITVAGAGLWFGSTFGVPDNFDLLIDGNSMKRACRVVWKEPHKIGVQFK